jgi:TonB-dependent starch-binding outer membrane protein SusC
MIRPARQRVSSGPDLLFEPSLITKTAYEMKSSVVAFVLAFQVLTIPCRSQTPTITLHMKARLPAVLDVFEKTGYCRFAYSIEDLPLTIITVDFRKVPIRKAVHSLFRDLPVKDSFLYISNGRYCFSLYPDASPPVVVTLPQAVVESYNNGLQQLRTATATGSVYVLKQPDAQRVISSNPLDQLPWQVSALLSDPNVNSPLNLAIHGRNSLHSINGPYLLLDGFVNFANPQDFNPNDIESYTIMKDASSAGIWGTFGSNGVIAATSYIGIPPGSFRYTLTENLTAQGKPDLPYIPQISTHSYIGMEEQLFAQGYYDNIIPTWQAITPVVALLYQQLSHQRSPGSVAATINYLGRFDQRDERLRYLYRSSFDDQFHFSVAGSGKEDRYYLSVGYDVVPTPLVRNNYQRFTTHLTNTYQLIPHRLELAATLQLTATRILDNNTGTIPVSYPYGPMADRHGNPLPMNYLYNPFYIDTAGGGQLLNWQYRPLQELALADNRLSRNSGYVDARLTYTLPCRLSASIEYRQFVSGSTERDLHNQNSFYARNLINRLSSLGPQGVIYNIPPGDMLFSSDTSEQSHHLRLKITYNTPNQLTVFAGADLNDLSIVAHSGWQYGYDPRTGESQPVNFAETFNDYVTGGSVSIPGAGEPLGQYYRYLSVFSNAAYSYRDKLFCYGSLRKDATNIVGAVANRQWAPFWSLGAGWDLLHDRKAGSGSLGFLKLRSSYGSSGNISDRVAYLQTQAIGPNLFGAPQNGIASAPDPGLTWETTYTWNTGLDYGFFKDPLSPAGRLRGSLDGYLKRSVHLLGYDSLPPSAGVPVFFGNSAATRGHGMDWVFNSDNIRGNRNQFQWTSTLLFSWATDRVTRYLMQPTANGDYIAGRYPRVGKSSTALFAYDWAGLDPASGDPRGYVNHQPGNDYSTIIGGSEGLHTYSGYLPQVFGSLINTFQYKRLKLSALFTLKAAYWIRRPSVNYTQMLIGAYPGTKDFDERWQVPGDERKTSVPSFPSQQDWNNTSRDDFYQNSSVLVCKGDHLRWQDLRLDYIVKNSKRPDHGGYQLDVYAYVSGLGIIWRSNRYGIDPDAAVFGTVPVSRIYSMGFRLHY